MILTIDRDKNGNKIVRVKVEGHRSFSIQTNGNLPYVHKWIHGRPDNIDDELFSEVEIEDYVKKHGTKHQKEILGLRTSQ